MYGLPSFFVFRKYVLTEGDRRSMKKKKTKDYPGDYVRQRHIEFIKANFELLAAASYEGFLKDCRGMVMLADEDFIDKPLGVLTKYRRVYVAKGNEAFAVMKNEWPGDKEAGWVKTYNPKTTMLIAFNRTDGGVSSYRITGVGEGIPALAYERSKGSQN